MSRGGPIVFGADPEPEPTEVIEAHDQPARPPGFALQRFAAQAGLPVHDGRQEAGARGFDVAADTGPRRRRLLPRGMPGA